MDAGAPMALPAGLAQLPPGPQLSAALASVDETRLTAHQLTIVIAARCRQVSYEQSRLLVAMRELSYAPAPERDRVVRDESPNRFNALEAAMAAAWTQYRTDQIMQLATFALEQVPDLGRALAAGRIDLEKVKIFHRLLANVVDVETMRALVAQALPHASRTTSAAVRARVQWLLARLDPAALRRQRERDHRHRFLHRTPDLSGLVTLSARFADPAAAAAAYDHVDAIATATKTAGDPLGRDIDQLRHDIALNLLAGVDPTQAACATPAQRKGTVTVHVDLATLIGPSAIGPSAVLGQPVGGCVDEPGEIDGIGPVPAYLARQTVAQLAEVSRWRYAIENDGELIAEGALPKDLIPELVEQMRRWAVDATAGADGRRHYRPTQAQIAFVRARDRRCQAPGCRVPAQKCQVDHRIPWHKGGPTFVDNLVLLCALHHRAKDEAGFTYRRVRGGIAWTTPTGRHYVRLRDHDGRHRRRRHHEPDITITVDVTRLHRGPIRRRRQ